MVVGTYFKNTFKTFESLSEIAMFGRLTFEELRDFLSRHPSLHITSLHIVRAFTRTCTLPTVLLKNLAELIASTICFPSLIPSSDQTSSFRFSFDLLPCYAHSMIDRTCMADTLTRIAETSIGKLRLNLAIEKEAVWMQNQIASSGMLIPLVNVTLLKIELASNRQAKGILPEFLGWQFPHLTECCVSFWFFFGVEVILGELSINEVSADKSRSEPR